MAQQKFAAALIFAGEAHVFKMIYSQLSEQFTIRHAYTVPGQPGTAFMESKEVNIPVTIVTPEDMLHGKAFNSATGYIFLSGIDTDFGNNLRKQFPEIDIYNLDTRWAQLHP